MTWIPSIGEIGGLEPEFGDAFGEGAYGDIEQALVSILRANGTVSGLVGTRIYPLTIPQDADRPAVTYQQISGPRLHTCAGPVGIVPSRFQFNCWDDSYGGADALAVAVRKALDGFSGIAATVTIPIISILGEGDLIDMRGGLTRVRPQGKRMDFRVWFKESTE